MAFLVSALDKHTPKQIGENGNIEYSWSNDFQEMFSQLYFQLVRTKDTSQLEKNLGKMLIHFKQPQTEYKNFDNCLKYEQEFTNLYKLIGHTRDVKDGKGEYSLSYMQLWVWYQHFPDLAKKAFETFVIQKNDHPYGSWKDVKYFCEYIKQRNSGIENHDFIEFCVDLIVNQLKEDDEKLRRHNESTTDTNLSISLAGKWCPREKGRFSWLFKHITKKMYSDIYATANLSQLESSKKRAHNKACMMMNRMLAKLNKYLDTTQVKMCDKQWATIKFNNVTSLTMSKNKNAFLNKKNKKDQDRILCAANLIEHIEKAKKGDVTAKVHGKRVNVYEMVKDADNLNNSFDIDNDTKDIINLQWKDNASQNMGLKNIIPLADTSGSMTCDHCIPLYNSIGLSIRISELNEEPFKNRIMTFSARPEWIQLNDSQTFVDKVEIVSNANWGMNTNFYAALKMILDVALEANMSPEQVSNMTLAVFSDMQIDQASTENMGTMMENIKEMYKNAGLQSSWNTPFKPPHILFWNLRSTSGFPVLSTEDNVTMLSGYNAVLLNAFCNKGLEELKTFTPYRMITDILSKERYDIMQTTINETFHK